jgi:hypothetical protein
MQRKLRKSAAILAVSGLALATAAPVASAEPPKGQGYFKDVNGGGAGESECAGPHVDQLPNGQAKKCD